MPSINIYGKGLLVEGGPYAVWLYKKEFGTDLLMDVSASISGGEVCTATWLQVIYAMNRTADDNVPEYSEWLRSFPDFTLGDQRAVEVMDSAITAGFFRHGRKATARTRIFEAAARLVHRLEVALYRLAGWDSPR